MDEEEEDDERKALLLSSQLVQLRGFVDGAAAKTLAFHLEPKVGGHVMLVGYTFLRDDQYAPCLLDADRGAEGVHALLRMRQESPEAHLQDGRYDQTTDPHP
jgi:hypothetical protein